MKHEKRSHWFLITCDLDSCDSYAVTHPALFEPDEPAGWYFISPPRYWKGPKLAFCSQEHRDLFVGNVVRPQLTAGEVREVRDGTSAGGQEPPAGSQNDESMGAR